MFVSVNPSYLCNFRCNFCYLTKEQLADAKRIELTTLDALINEIKIFKPTEELTFDLYGGEISSLPDDYVLALLDLLYKYTHEPVRITTNLARVPSYLYDARIDIAVSYDGTARQDSALVKENMKVLGSKKPYNILTLVSKKLITQGFPRLFLEELMTLPNIQSLEYKSYSKNQANQHKVSFLDFEKYMKKVIESYEILEPYYNLNNLDLLEAVIRNEHNAFSDDHIYITPNGQYAVLEFDENDNELFTEFNFFTQYLNWCDKEKLDVMSNSYCMSCEYFGKCLSEHLREVKDISESCNGFKGLIDWYKDAK